MYAGGADQGPQNALLCCVNSHTFDHSLANCSTRATTGTPAIVPATKH